MYFMALELMKAMINQLHAMNEALTMRFVRIQQPNFAFKPGAQYILNDVMQIPATPGCAPPDPANVKQPQPSV